MTGVTESAALPTMGTANWPGSGFSHAGVLHMLPCVLCDGTAGTVFGNDFCRYDAST